LLVAKRAMRDLDGGADAVDDQSDESGHHGPDVVNR
jgi:hypothetical protein